MDETKITLRRVCACAIPGALEALAKYALQQGGSNRPRCPFLTVLRVENDMVPVAIQLRRQGTLQSWGLYDKLPCPGDPLGNRELGVTTALCPGCQAKVAAGINDGRPVPAPGAHGCSHTPCDGCDGDCCEELEVYFTYFPGFPLAPHEVRWFFFDYFHMDAEAQAALPKNYRNMAVVYLEHDAPPVPGAQPDRRPDTEPGEAAGCAGDCGTGEASADCGPQPAARRKAGAPQLDCNVWLYTTMCALPDPRAYGHLRPEWRDRYLQQMGVEPADWDKSFREAARHYLHRILRDRDEADAEGQDGDGQVGQADA